MKSLKLFSSESVTEGHPDKICDQISDTLLDAILEQDPLARVAIETMVTTGLVHVAGELTTTAYVEMPKIIREKIIEIGYTSSDIGFDGSSCGVSMSIGQQSPDIAQGVDSKKAKGKATDEQGAGDQGLMFGFACNETPELMPAPIMFAHRLGRELTAIRKAGKVKWLRPDAKSQVSVLYEGGKPVRVTNVVISTQHTEDVENEEIRRFLIANVIRKVIPKDFLNASTEFLINPTGRFVIGGPQGDSGLTGRKIIVDTYGGMGRHGGGAFSGKDPSKVDRSAAYMGRYVAKNVVAAGLADRCEVQFAYAIGHPQPVSIHIDTFGTNKVAEENIEKAVKSVFSFKPADIVSQLNLLRPIYSKTTNYGHFGKEDKEITWERTDKAAALKKAAR